MRDEARQNRLHYREEAHEFLSSERIKQMSILFQQVARIARRGRKLWLSVVDDSVWQRLPNPAPGQVLVAMAIFTRPRLVNINPTP